MSDEKSNIEIRVSAEGTAQTAADLNGVANAAGNMEAGTGRASVGAKGLMFAANGMAHELGVSGSMARYLGHEVGALAAGLGGGALAFGAVSLAAMVTYKVYEHFTEAAKAKRDEIDKNVKALEGEIKALYANGLQTAGVIAGHEDLLRLKKDIYLIDAKERIRVETEELAKLHKEQKEGIGNWEKLKIVMAASGGTQEQVDAKVQLAMTQKNTKQIETIKLKELELKLDQETYNAVKGGGPTPTQQKEFDAKEAEAKKVEELMQSFRNREVLLGLDADNKELQQLDTKHAEEFQKLIDNHAAKEQLEEAYGIQIAERKDKEAQQDLKRQQNQAKMEKQLNDYKFQTARSSLDAINTLTHGKYKAIYLAQQAMLAGQAIMHGNAAAAAAIAPPPIGVGPELGAPLAFWARAQGYAAAAAIMAQAFTSSGGGGGASGTYAANPATGQPSDSSGSPYKYYSYEQSNYGSAWRPESAPQHVRVEVVVNDDAFTTKVVKAVSGDIRKRGETYDLVNNHA